MKDERSEFRAKFYSVLLFALAGALYWGMRGCDGYGGITGAVIPGLFWGLTWYFLSYLRGVPNPYIVPACALGFGLGGYNGYGQFVAWMSGAFHINYPQEWIPVPRWLGFAWMFACGAGWGGLGGWFVSAALRPERKLLPNVIRFLCLPVGAAAGALIVARHPGIFAPLYSPELYDPSKCTDCARTLGTLPIAGAFNGMLLLTVIHDIVRRRWASLKIVLILALGFGIAFAGCSPFHLIRTSVVSFDWWKAWEMSLGAVAGVSIAIVFLFFDKVETNHITGSKQFFGVDFVIFIVFNWAFFNCAGVFLRYVFPGFDSTAALAANVSIFIPAFLVSLCLLVVHSRKTSIEIKNNRDYQDRYARKKILLAHSAFSIMAFVVIFPSRNTLAVFILLSLAIFLLFGWFRRNHLKLSGVQGFSQNNFEPAARA